MSMFLAVSAAIFCIVSAGYVSWQMKQEKKRDPDNAVKTSIMGIGAVTSILTHTIILTSVFKDSAKKE